MKFLSLCSGIESASVALGPLGWEAVAFAEIEPFPCAVLAHHYPHVPNLGDITKHHDWPPLRFRALVGGPPCQGFSLAGLRKGLADPRSRLSLVYVEIAAKYRPAWLVWENVPGVLSSAGGQDFADLLAAFTGRKVRVPAGGWQNSGVLEGIPEAYGVAWRVLDAQHCGVPQRRRRVFIVGYLGDWRLAAAVLLERAGLSGNPPPRREPGQGLAGTLTRAALDGSSPCGGDGREGLLVSALPAGDEPAADGSAVAGHSGVVDASGVIAHTLRGEGFDASEDGTGRGVPIVGCAEVAPTLDASYGRLQGCSGQDADHGHGHLVACADTAPALGASTKGGGGLGTDFDLNGGLIASTVTAKWAKGSGGPSGDECQNLVTSQDVAPPLTTNPSADNDGREGLLIAFDSKASGRNGFAVGEISPTLRAMGHKGSHQNAGGQVAVAFSPQAGGEQTTLGFDPESGTCPALTSGQTPAICFDTTQITSPDNRCNPQLGDPCHPLASGAHPPAVAFSARERGDDGRGYDRPPHVFEEGVVGTLDTMKPHCVAGMGTNLASTLTANYGKQIDSSDTSKGPPNIIVSGPYVRRLTPRECERLQGFPDDYTLIPGDWRPRKERDRAETVAYLVASGYPREEAEALADSPDGHRYRALGNSKAVPVVRWIGARIDAVEALVLKTPAA
jgi:DNA (cytosine-5)-methyltransferase 1